MHIFLLRELLLLITLLPKVTVANNTNKKVIFKNCAPFTNCISEINNTQIDNAKDIDIVMPMYNLIEYSDNYAKQQKVYGNIVKIYQLEIMMMKLLFLL